MRSVRSARKWACLQVLAVLACSCGSDSDKDGSGDALPDFATTPMAGVINSVPFELKGATAEIETDEQGQEELSFSFYGVVHPNHCFYRGDYKESSYISHRTQKVTGEYALRPLSLDSDGPDPVLVNFIHAQADESKGPMNYLVGRGKVAIDTITETAVTGRMLAQERDDGAYKVDGTFTANICWMVDLNMTDGVPAAHQAGVYGPFAAGDKTYLSVPDMYTDVQHVVVYVYDGGFSPVSGFLGFEANSGALGTRYAKEGAPSVYTPLAACPEVSPVKEACILAGVTESLVLQLAEQKIGVSLDLDSDQGAESLVSLTKVTQLVLDHPEEFKAYALRKKVKSIHIADQGYGSDQLTRSDGIMFLSNDTGSTEAMVRQELGIESSF